MKTIQVTTVEEIQEVVQAQPSLQIVGGGSKPALSTPAEGSVGLNISELSGILEYEPGEYTFTALAGTPLATVEAALAEHGQTMPFDPPLSAAGATLGGTIAAGLSGSGRHRYGGVRDFLIGVRFVDGRGRLVRGGGKVVKNAAGFDLPKLMVGSLGQLGVLVEASFKVFPRPPAYATLRIEHPSVAAALDNLATLATARLDIDALDIAVTDDGASTWIRIGGLESTLQPRMDNMAGVLGGGTIFVGKKEQHIWRDASEFGWVPGNSALVKAPLSPSKLADFDRQIGGRGLPRRYIAGGNVAWLAWNQPLDRLDALLRECGLSSLLLAGETSRPILGSWPGATFYRRIKQTLDPDRRFPDYISNP